MKVAFLSNGIYPNEAHGSAYSSRIITDGLKKRGYEVDVFVRRLDTKSWAKVEEGHYSLPSGKGSLLPDRISSNVLTYRYLPQLSEYDLLHVYGSNPLPASVVRSDIPVIGTMNTLSWVCIDWVKYLRDGCPEYSFIDAIENAKSEGYTGLLLPKLLLEFTGKTLSKRADAISVQTSGMKEILTRCGYDDEKIHVIPNLTDPCFNSLNDVDRKKTIIFLGRLIERKGVLDIVEVFQNLPENLRSEWSLEIYGKGPLESRIEELSSSTDSVVLDYCEYDELPKLYAKSGVMIHGSKYPEPFSRTWLEAMESGTPIICSENPSSRSVLGGVAELYDPFDQDSLRESMINALRNERKREMMSYNSKKEVKKYKTDLVIDQYEKIFNRFAG